MLCCGPSSCSLRSCLVQPDDDGNPAPPPPPRPAARPKPAARPAPKPRTPEPVAAARPNPEPTTAPADPGKAAAQAEKEAGNAAYKAKRFEPALAHYSKAIELDDTDISFLTNRRALGRRSRCVAA